MSRKHPAKPRQNEGASPTAFPAQTGPTKWWKSPEIWTAIGTVVLAAFGIPSFIFLYLQLQESHKALTVDQRAWLKVETPPDQPGGDKFTVQFTTGQPVSYALRVMNIGKTPARNVDMKIFVDIVASTQEPSLNHVDESSSYPHGHITAGIIYANSDFKQTVVRPSESGGPLVATDDEVSAVRDGRAFLAVYGIITYDDIFDAHHWTRFCNWVAVKGSFRAERCTHYNSVGDN